jgi:hypothetical protein
MLPVDVFNQQQPGLPPGRCSIADCAVCTCLSYSSCAVPGRVCPTAGCAVPGRVCVSECSPAACTILGDGLQQLLLHLETCPSIQADVLHLDVCVYKSEHLLHLTYTDLSTGATVLCLLPLDVSA